jgi:hypothetical protein
MDGEIQPNIMACFKRLRGRDPAWEYGPSHRAAQASLEVTIATRALSAGTPVNEGATAAGAAFGFAVFREFGPDAWALLKLDVMNESPLSLVLWRRKGHPLRAHSEIRFEIDQFSHGNPTVFPRKNNLLREPEEYSSGENRYTKERK